MKIRADFVTNSSSVSYILTMKEDMFNIFSNYVSEEKRPLYAAIANLIRNGERNTVCGENIRSTIVKFDTDDGILSEDTLDNLPDFSEMSLDEIMPYIYSYILYGRLSDLVVFGATRVETY